MESYAEKDFQELKQNYTGPEEIYGNGKEIYIYYSKGIGSSKLTTALFDRKLKVSGTARNWNTLLKISEECLRS